MTTPADRRWRATHGSETHEFVTTHNHPLDPGQERFLAQNDSPFQQWFDGACLGWVDESLEDNGWTVEEIKQ